MFGCHEFSWSVLTLWTDVLVLKITGVFQVWSWYVLLLTQKKCNEIRFFFPFLWFYQKPDQSTDYINLNMKTLPTVEN